METKKEVLAPGSVNYDEAPVAELAVEGMEYRVDIGLGAQVAVSSRSEGTWSWAFVVEGRWDGSSLRARGLDHAVRESLAQALGHSMRRAREGLE